MKEITEKEALGKMASYCSLSEHCRSEVEEKLRKWELDDESIQRIIQTLVEENYLNEERYCESFIHDKLFFNKWGKLKLAQALYFKRIPDKIIRKYLDKIDEEEYLEILSKLIEAKQKTIKAKNDYEFKAKLMRFAYSKGFDSEDIAKCLQND
ncbi:regulatory protein RecX [Bacteroides sp. 519]|uniref:regulatory protein RecX n=1 Tax=Bacteroides sp. 519 TaxID=2302937 RepID=UPI0013D150AA|nr:regulatory protein RecX [Bacteroides sp. 519]NDV57177.1 RecX family transcriptional regulator [Bacteroides sp. 519]